MLLVAFILFIWFESDITITLIKMLKLDDKLYLKDYEKERLEFSGKLSYIDFLHVKKPCLITKLISCPICLCFWLTLFYCIITYANLFFILNYFAFHYLTNLIVYLLVKKIYDNQ